MDADHGLIGPSGPGGRPVRRITAEEVRPLRGRALRPGQEHGETAYAGDDTAVHLGVFAGDELVGIASLYREDRAGGPAGGWRLRGMATDAGVRGQGLGAALLGACADEVAAAGGAELWCNARMSAVGFYLRAGFTVVSDEFDITGIGPHVVMTRPLPA